MGIWLAALSVPGGRVVDSLAVAANTLRHEQRPAPRGTGPGVLNVWLAPLLLLRAVERLSGVGGPGGYAP